MKASSISWALYCCSASNFIICHGLVELARANLRPLRGKGGGYKLTRQPESYTVGSILKLTEGTLAPVACLEENAAPCQRAAECRTLPMWQKLDTLIDNFFEGITLSELTAETKQQAGDNYII